MSSKSVLAFLLSLLLAGCSGGGNGSSPVDDAADDPGAGETPAAPTTPGNFTGEWDPSKGTATIRGAVNFQGEAPRRRPIDMGADAACKALHTEPLLDKSVLVNDNNSLQNVFVWVKSGLEGVEFPTPTEPKILDQKGCQYVPHVQGIQVGQPLLIRNSDPFLHNVHSLAKKNRSWNFGQSTQGAETKKQFRRQEVMVRVKCDVHGWMSSYVGVLEHPFYDTTGEDGAFELQGVPPGKYTIEAWHEVYGTKTADVTVADGETKDISFTFEE